MKPSAIWLWALKRFNGDFHEITYREEFNWINYSHTDVPERYEDGSR